MTDKPTRSMTKGTSQPSSLNLNISQADKQDKPESDKQFLERTNVQGILNKDYEIHILTVFNRYQNKYFIEGILNNLLKSLYCHQPDDALSFMCS